MSTIRDLVEKEFVELNDNEVLELISGIRRSRQVPKKKHKSTKSTKKQPPVKKLLDKITPEMAKTLLERMGVE